MKICFIIQGMRKGGAERVASELCNWFVKSGNKVVLILTEQHDSPCYFLDKSVEVIYLEQKKTLIANRVNMISELKSNIKKENPDICISFITRTNVYAIIACKLLGKKIIISERNDPARAPKGKIMRFMRWVFYRFSDGIVFQTRYAKEYFSKGIQRKSAVIANPLSEKLYEYNVKLDKKNKIVGVGRLVKQKNFPLLINSFCDIMEEFPSYKLYIYGKGEEKETLEELIKRRDAVERVILFGQTDNIYDEISDAEIFVLSSDFEGMPNALAEGMALGLCCISTNCPAYGSEYLIDNMKNGILIPVDDREELSKTIKMLIKDNELRQTLADNAKKIKTNMSLANIGMQWLKFIKITTRQSDGKY